MKLFFSFFFIFTLIFSTGGQTKQPLVKFNREAFISRTGGLVKRAYTGNVIMVINSQRMIPQEILKKIIAKLHNDTSLPVLFINTHYIENFSSVVLKLRKEKKAGICIFVTEKKQESPIITVPEGPWGIISVKSLSEDRPSNTLLAKRTEKEMWRALLYTLGAGSDPNCLTRPIVSLKQLDGLPDAPTISTIGKLLSLAQSLRITRPRLTSYRKACDEGWAPAPTNSYQKAIWEEFHKSQPKK